MPTFFIAKETMDTFEVSRKYLGKVGSVFPTKKNDDFKVTRFIPEIYWVPAVYISFRFKLHYERRQSRSLASTTAPPKLQQPLYLAWETSKKRGVKSKYAE